MVTGQKCLILGLRLWDTTWFVKGKFTKKDKTAKYNIFLKLLYATLVYATLRYSTLLYAILRYSTLLYATLRYSTLRYTVGEMTVFAPD
jgi:hypothetical protein